MTPRLPNFLIVGMAKCGTSSLSNYLQQHPEVFMSERKEPRFVSSQCTQLPLGGPKDKLVEDWYVKDFESYQALFKNANHKVIGEASADTLYFYEKTIPVIKSYFDNPKIIIILRDPVKRAISAYQHLIRDAREDSSFEGALEKEQERIRLNYELIYHYRACSHYFEPIKAFMQSFDEVKILLSDDLSNKTQETMSDVFRFLEIDDQFKVDSSLRFNESGKPKNRLLHNVLQNENFIKSMIRPIVRMVFSSKEKRIRAMNWLSSKNLKKISIKEKTKQDLYKEFKEDIHNTSQLTGLDLSKWMM